MLLCIDSSGLTASVAILDEDTAIAEYTVNLKKTHSETLLPMIDELYKVTGLDKSLIKAVAVAAGPGSFTGLRIGGATAKGIATALNVPIVPVPTVDGMAYTHYGREGLICPIMDARRGQTYTGIFEFKPQAGNNNTCYYKMECRMEACAVSIEELIDKLNLMGRDVLFMGDGIPVFKDRIDEGLTVTHTYAPAGLNRQNAVSIGRLAYEYMAEGKTVSAADFAPEYLRQSQAEREREEAGSGTE